MCVCSSRYIKLYVFYAFMGKRAKHMHTRESARARIRSKHEGACVPKAPVSTQARSCYWGGGGRGRGLLPHPDGEDTPDSCSSRRDDDGVFVLQKLVGEVIVLMCLSCQRIYCSHVPQ